MGYNMRQVYSEFRIKASNRKKAREAVRALADNPQSIAWVDKGILRVGEYLADVLDEFGWRIQESTMTGDIVDIAFTREKAGDEDLLFTTLAPYVEDGSYIEMLGEDGTRWKWVFTGKTVKRQTARVVWEES